MITILDGNAFYLRITGKTKVGEYEATLDLEAIDSLIVNFVRRVRESQAVTHDGGMVLAYNDGKLAKGVYGVEMVGYYNGQPWRYYAPEVFEIADGGETEASNVIGSVNVYDVTFYMKLGGDGVTPGYVDAAVTMHNTSEEAHSDMRDAITGIRTQVERRLVGARVTFSDGHTEDVELGFNDQGEVILLLPKETFGKIDGVKVNGEELSVDEQGKVNVPVPTSVEDLDQEGEYAKKTDLPTSVAELSDASDYATAQQLNEGLAGKQDTINEVSISYQEDEGSPDASVDFENGALSFTMKNMKLRYSDLNSEDKAELKGEKGDPGDSVIVGQGDLPLANTLGNSSEKAITQKAVTDEMIWTETTVESTNDVSSDRRYISDSTWKSESTTTQGAIFAVTPGKPYILAASQGDISYAFVTAKSSANNDPVSFAGGATALTSLTNGLSVIIAAPNDAVYLYTSRKTSSTLVLPSVKELVWIKDHIKDLDDDISDLDASVDERLDGMGARIDAKDDEIRDAKTYKIALLSPYTQSGTTKYNRYIDANDTWQSGTSAAGGSVFKASEGQTFKVVTQNDYDVNTAYAFVQEAGIGDVGDSVSYATGSSRQTLGRNVTAYLMAPALTKYLYVSRTASVGTIIPTVSRVEFVKEVLEEHGEIIGNANSILPLLGLTNEQDITNDIEWAGNGYVSIDQIIASSNISHYSTPIAISAGQCIIVKTRVNTAYMVLSEDTGQNSSAKYNVLVRGISAPSEADGLTTYAYIAPRNMNVVISTLKSSDCKVVIRSKENDLVTSLHDKLYKPQQPINVLAAFDNLVAIGDSLTKGVVYTASNTSRIANRPYPKVLQKICGFDNLNVYAEGGKNAEYIWETFNQQFAIPQNGKTLCIVFLGTNGGFTDTLSTDAPSDADPSTWDMAKRVACYARIVKTFYDFGCCVLLIKPWTAGNGDLSATFSVIDGVAERYGCAIIKAGDIKSNDFKYHCFPTHNGVNLLHFNELGYAHFASGIINAVNELPDDNIKFLVPR